MTPYQADHVLKTPTVYVIVPLQSKVMNFCTLSVCEENLGSSVEASQKTQSGCAKRGMAGGQQRRGKMNNANASIGSIDGQKKNLIKNQHIWQETMTFVRAGLHARKRVEVPPGFCLQAALGALKMVADNLQSPVDFLLAEPLSVISSTRFLASTDRRGFRKSRNGEKNG